MNLDDQQHMRWIASSYWRLKQEAVNGNGLGFFCCGCYRCHFHSCSAFALMHLGWCKILVVSSWKVSLAKNWSGFVILCLSLLRKGCSWVCGSIQLYLYCRWGRRQAADSPGPTFVASRPVSACSQCYACRACSLSSLLSGVFLGYWCAKFW